MSPKPGIPKGSRWPTREVLVGCYLLSLAGCDGGSLTAPAVAAALDDDPNTGAGRHRSAPRVNLVGDPNAVQVKAARLRRTSGGCEVDVTFTNVTGKTLSAGFEVDILDAAGRHVISRSTAVQQAGPGVTTTVSSEGTTAGPTGGPCPVGGRTRLAEVSVFNF